MQSALHENLVATEGDRFFDFLQQLFARQDIALIAFRSPVECTEVTNRGTDIRVVDVAVNVVSAIIFRMLPFGHRIGRFS